MKQLSVTVGIALLFTATCLPLAAAAQGAPPSYQPPPGTPPPPGSMPPGLPPGSGLMAAKQRRLAEIQQHMATLQNEQTCVQNAQDHDQLRSCRPPRHDR